MVMASSKSLACSPSIVTVVTARKSVLPLNVLFLNGTNKAPRLLHSRGGVVPRERRACG